MSLSAAATVSLILAASALAIALVAVRARLRTLEAAFAGVRLDVAARHDALRDSDRSRRRMLAEVSYELKTPLTAMRGYLETLHMSNLDLDQVTRERYVRTIEREIVRL